MLGRANLLVILIVVFIVVAWPAAPATAHAALVRSDPPAGATLERPPDQIRMWFAEPLETTYTGADLRTPRGIPFPAPR